MTEHEMKPGQEMTVQSAIRMEMGAALNLHTKAKEISHIDAMQSEDSMQRILNLAKTRKGLQELISLTQEKTSQLK